jgi:hypothetical protein
MSEYELYVQRVAANGALGLRSTLREPELAPELVERYGEEPLCEGLRGLRDLMARLYSEMGAHPREFGIPLVPDEKVTDTPSRRKVRGPFEAPLKLLYVLGVTGTLRGSGRAPSLVASVAGASDALKRMGAKDLPAAARALAQVGFELDRRPADEGLGEELVASADRLGYVPMALKAFVDVCRLWERGKLKAPQMPHAFLLADFRILRQTDSRARLPRLTLEDALPYVPANQVGDLLDLVQHMKSMGYRAEMGRANLLDGEFHGVYVDPKHGWRLFGFTACRGWLNLRLTLADAGRIMPHIDECPAPLRREILRQRCGKCGGTGCGKEVPVEVDGEKYDVCHFGLFGIGTWQTSDIPHLKRLLTIQAGFQAG